MKIKRLVVGILEENCYILEKNNKLLIIDPGDNFNLINKYINNKNVVGVLITHHHNDHIGALNEVLKFYDLKENIVNDIDFDFEIIKTPGHSSDSISYYFKKENIMFTGDFLFKDAIGRVDLPTGSSEEMIESLYKIMDYPDNVQIYPGHGDNTILGREKKNFKYYISLI